MIVFLVWELLLLLIVHVLLVVLVVTLFLLLGSSLLLPLLLDESLLLLAQRCSSSSGSVIVFEHDVNEICILVLLGGCASPQGVEGHEVRMQQLQDLLQPEDPRQCLVLAQETQAH